MKTFEKLQLYRKAIAKWGVLAQMDMAVEECAELIKTLQKRKRNQAPCSVDNVLEEMADVEIMIEQLKLIYDYDQNEESTFEQFKTMKLIRLKRRLSNENAL